MIEWIVERGRPIVVAADVTPMPETVEVPPELRRRGLDARDGPPDRRETTPDPRASLRRRPPARRDGRRAVRLRRSRGSVRAHRPKAPARDRPRRSHCPRRRRRRASRQFSRISRKTTKPTRSPPNTSPESSPRKKRIKDRRATGRPPPVPRRHARGPPRGTRRPDRGPRGRTHRLKREAKEGQKGPRSEPPRAQGEPTRARTRRGPRRDRSARG